MNKRNTLLLILGFLVVGGGFLVVFLNTTRPSEDFSALAQCLSRKGVIMYGAAWCSHCQNQKNEFGKAFSFVPYVECPDSPQACIEAGIKAYPTWVFPDGTKIEGEISPVRLGELSGCSLR